MAGLPSRTSVILHDYVLHVYGFPMASGLSGRKLAARMFRVIVQHAVAMVPVAGPVLSLSVDLIDTVYTEVEEARGLSREEIITILRKLDQVLVDRTVDNVLITDQGTHATEKLSSRELLQLRRQLVSLPSALGRALDEAIMRDRNKLTQEKQSREQKRVSLEDELAFQIRAGNWGHAQSLVDQRYELGGTSRDFRRIDKYLYRKQGRELPYIKICVFVTLWFGVFWVITALTYSHHHSPSPATPSPHIGFLASSVLLLAVYLALIFALFATPHVSRRPRAILTFLFFIIAALAPMVTSLLL